MIEDAERTSELLEQEVRDARARDKRQKWWLFGLAMLLMVAVAVIGILLVQTKDRAERSEGVAVAEQSEKKDLAKEAQRALCGTKDTEIFDKALCEKLAHAAQEPVELPENTGPSREELVTAFRAYCAEGDNCKGRDGASPTPDDIAAAFGRFCADGRCNGPAGKDAPAVEYETVLAAVTDVCATGACKGEPGVNGTDGQDGADATQEMVLAAAQTYCANDACRGPKGDPGKDGKDGTQGVQGVSITNVQCVGEGSESTWQITLSDGAVLNGGGPCKVSIVPPVKTEVTP